MGTKESVSSSKAEKSCSPLQEQPSFYPYPDWASMQTYYGSGFPIPPHYFNAIVAPGHTPHPYMWSPQPMMPHFVGPYTIYPHGGVYSHPSAAHMVSPVNQEMPAKSSASKERVEKTSKLLDGRAASVGNGNAESGECNGSGHSQRGDSEEEGSFDGSEGFTESGGSKNKRSMSSEDIPNSEKITPTTISLEMTATYASITTKNLVPVSLPNSTPAVDLNASSSSKLNPGGKPLLRTSSVVQERELKREKRKQSNRESARRSRLRKQAETEELAVKVGTLSAENTTLISEITRLTESSEKLRLENATLMEKLKMRGLNQAEDVAPDGTDNYEAAPTILIENLLSRIDNSNPTGGSNQMEDKLHKDSNGKLYQLLDSNPRTDTVAASS